MPATMEIAKLRTAGQESWIHATVPVVVDAVLEKSSASGKPYLEVQLCDARDRFALRVWSDNGQYDAARSLASGACLRLEGEFHLHPQFGLEARKWSFRALEGKEKEEFLAGPPDLRAKQEEDYQFIAEQVAATNDPRLKALAESFLDKFGPRFRRTAAARFFHHARRGGLVEHTAQMMRYAGALCAVNPDLHRDLLVAGVLFHDSGKLWENCVEEGGFAMPFDERGELLGHINIGIELVTKKRRDQDLDLSVPPSQSPDREEVVSIMAEAREVRAQRFLFIQRDSLGKFTGFGTSLLPQIQDVEGRFAGLLPPKEPTDEMAMAARNLLQAMGVAIEQVGPDPRWN